MIEILILHVLSDKVLTMYGISKSIKDEFYAITQPSIGTIKPALVRLEKKGFIKSQKVMSPGGRPSVYYSITKDGLSELKDLLLTPPLKNTINFLPLSRIKIACSCVLDNVEQFNLFKQLKFRAENIYLAAQKMQDNDNLDFNQKFVYENIVCEYKNFISLLEGLLRACKN